MGNQLMMCTGRRDLGRFPNTVREWEPLSAREKSLSVSVLDKCEVLEELEEEEEEEEGGSNKVCRKGL